MENFVCCCTEFENVVVVNKELNNYNVDHGVLENIVVDYIVFGVEKFVPGVYFLLGVVYFVLGVV